MRRTSHNSELIPYSVGSRTINRDWFGMPVSDVYQILSEQLYFVSNAYDLKVFLFLVMSNHFHLIAASPSGEMGPAMQFFLAQSSRQIAKSSGRINHTWRARFFRREIGTARYFLHAYKYFYRNPVEVGLCERVEDYPFSTLHGLLGQSQLIVPMVHDDTLFADVEGTLEWLNTPGTPENKEAIRKALRRSKFTLPRNFRTSRRHPLEHEDY